MSEDIVQRVKEANELQDVVMGDGYPLRRSGRYWTGTRDDCNSLVVDAVKQMFVWNSRLGDGWAGDTIRWVEKQRGVSFKGAVEWLAERGHIEVKWGRVDEGAMRTARAREDAFEIAIRVWGQWLWKDEAALGYARGRGWTDETIRLAGLGFTGRKTAEEYKEMKNELSLNGIEVDSPAAVSVLGYRGDLRGWGRKWEVEVEGESWVDWGMIPGAMGKMRLAYPHWYGGRVRYFSCRTILEDREFEGEREIKGKWNPYEKLAGPKQVYFNPLYQRGAEEMVIVEGQADAISLGQWGFPAAALCGLSTREGAIEGLKRAISSPMPGQGKTTYYVALDADGAGQANALKLARRLGPMARLVNVG